MSVSVSASLLKQLLVRSFVVCFIKILLVFCLSLYIFILILSIFVVIHPSNKTRAIWRSTENVASWVLKGNSKTLLVIYTENKSMQDPVMEMYILTPWGRDSKINPKSKAGQWDHRLIQHLSGFSKQLIMLLHVSGLLRACMHFLHHTGMLLMRWWMLSWGISSQNWIRTSVNSYATWQRWMQRCPRFTWMESDLGDGWASH